MSMNKIALVWSSVFLLQAACGDDTRFRGVFDAESNASPEQIEPIPQPSPTPPVAPRLGENETLPFVPPRIHRDPEIIPSPTPAPTPPPSGDIEFGTDLNFHIGDNNYSGSTCITAIEEYDNIGTTFFFDFEVLEDATKVDVGIYYFCGVDTDTTNLAQIESASSVVSPTITILRSDQEVVFPALTLNRGVYSIRIQSNPDPNNANDHDDFLIRNIRIRGDKPMQQGAIRFQ